VAFFFFLAFHCFHYIKITVTRSSIQHTLSQQLFCHLHYTNYSCRSSSPKTLVQPHSRWTFGMTEFVDKSRISHFKINSPYGYDVKIWHPWIINKFG